MGRGGFPVYAESLLTGQANTHLYAADFVTGKFTSVNNDNVHFTGKDPAHLPNAWHQSNYSLQTLASDFKAGAEIVLGTPPHVALNGLQGGHAYTVIGLTHAANGAVDGVRLFNPWGQGMAPREYFTVPANSLTTTNFNNISVSRSH
jgi:hypothetical protein